MPLAPTTTQFLDPSKKKRRVKRTGEVLASNDVQKSKAS